MSPSKDNLQEVVDGIRAELRKGHGGFFEIAYPGLKHPIHLDVVVDGATAWLVKITCGGEVLLNTGETSCYEPEEFLSHLYVTIRQAIKYLTSPRPTPPRPN